jgi:hypothetical protein
VVSAGNVLKIEPGSLCCSHTNNYLSMEIPLTCRSQQSQVLPVSAGSSARCRPAILQIKIAIRTSANLNTG